MHLHFLHNSFISALLSSWISSWKRDYSYYLKRMQTTAHFLCLWIFFSTLSFSLALISNLPTAFQYLTLPYIYLLSPWITSWKWDCIYYLKGCKLKLIFFALWNFFSSFVLSFTCSSFECFYLQPLQRTTVLLSQLSVKPWWFQPRQVWAGTMKSMSSCLIFMRSGSQHFRLLFTNCI